MLSPHYAEIIQRDDAKWFYWLDASKNTFEILLGIFHTIQNLDDFTHFRRNFPPEWIYIPAVRMQDIVLWNTMFSWVFSYHTEYDASFSKRMSEIWVHTENDFLSHMKNVYRKILDGWLPYEENFDMSVTFCNESVSDIIKKYCSPEAIQSCNKSLKIHPTEQRWTINKVLFFRATKENNYTKKMFDDYMEWKNSKRVAEDFIRYIHWK